MRTANNELLALYIGEILINIRPCNFIKLLSLVMLVTVAFQSLSNGIFSGLFVLMPYVIVFLLANKSSYKTTFRVCCRFIAGVLVSLISIGLVFGVNNDPQAGIGVLFAVIIQYVIIFVTEALIGFYTYEESNP